MCESSTVYHRPGECERQREGNESRHAREREKAVFQFSMAKAESEMITVFKGKLDEFKGIVHDFEGLVVANFWAQWCAPCRRLAGMLPQMASENPKVKFVKIDVDENPDLAEHYEITGIPNVRLFKGVDEQGVPIQVAEIQGLDNSALREAISKYQG